MNVLTTRQRIPITITQFKLGLVIFTILKHCKLEGSERKKGAKREKLKNTK